MTSLLQDIVTIFPSIIIILGVGILFVIFPQTWRIRSFRIANISVVIFAAALSLIVLAIEPTVYATYVPITNAAVYALTNVILVFYEMVKKRRLNHN